jgi:hypothetical protein
MLDKPNTAGPNGVVWDDGHGRMLILSQPAPSGRWHELDQAGPSTPWPVNAGSSVTGSPAPGLYLQIDTYWPGNRPEDPPGVLARLAG